jgi:hypothetical protein
MTQANAVDAWTETFLITVQSKGGTPKDFRADVTTYDVSGGEKNFSTIANAKGGRIKKFEVQTDYEVTLEGYAVEVGGEKGFYGLMFTDDTTNPESISTDHTRTNHCMSLMHTTSTSQTSAFDTTVAGDRALRDTFKNGHFTSVNQSFTDGICKFSVKFKSGPFDKDASANVTFESTNGSTSNVLPAITYS